MLRGSCLCGEVRWEYTGALDFIAACHCSMCRKVHGAAFAPFACGPAERYRLVHGSEHVVRYESTPGSFRPFCARCGSKLPHAPESSGIVGMPAGALDDDPGMRLSAHVFVASKAPWYVLHGDAPRFDAYPPGMNAPVFEGPRRVLAAGAQGGSCLCGGVVYELEGRFGTINHCHCSRCRKARGSAHASNLFGPSDGLRFVSGQELLDSYKVPEARVFTHVFCRVCGSSMPRIREGLAVVPAGTLDSDPGARQQHVFVGSKAPWFEIADDLPQFETVPPSF
jgi:hypothetical protein